MFGDMKVNGAMRTLRNNLATTKVQELGANGALVERSRGFAMVGRIGGVAIGSGMVVDAFTRAKTSDGEDRSFTARVIEGGTGAAAAVLSALAGKARVPVRA